MKMKKMNKSLTIAPLVGEGSMPRGIFCFIKLPGGTAGGGTHVWWKGSIPDQPLVRPSPPKNQLEQYKSPPT